MKKEYEVHCFWQMYGVDHVEAHSLTEAIEMVNSPHMERGLPAGNYVEDSFDIDWDATQDNNPEEGTEARLDQIGKEMEENARKHKEVVEGKEDGS